MTRCIAVSLLSFSALLATACSFDDKDDSAYWESQEGNAIPPEIMDAPIEPGQQIDVMPGTGAGLFIEYQPDGTWHIFASCDTQITNEACVWDVIALIPRTEDLEVTQEENLEPNYPDYDGTVRIDNAAVNWVVRTDIDFDGIFLKAPPGQPLRVDVLLDNGPALRFVNWISDGALNVGVPTNPIDFAPSGQ